jgi:hypothetical protein
VLIGVDPNRRYTAAQSPQTCRSRSANGAGDYYFAVGDAFIRMQFRIETR